MSYHSDKGIDMPFRGHHIWCNQMGNKPPEECKMCRQLKEKYPEGGMSEDELVKKHFPNVISRNIPPLQTSISSVIKDKKL